jgi:hypothetical protein
MERLDLRFCEDDDEEELTSLVASAFSHEETASYDARNPQQFRKICPRVSNEKIGRELKQSEMKWIVLETPYPAEEMVAFARFFADSAERCAQVVTFGAIGDSDEQRETRLKFILHKVEHIASSQRLLYIRIRIAQWDSRCQQLVESLGFVDNSGGEWPEDEAEMIWVPTMLLNFSKRIPNGSGSTVGSKISSSGSTSGIGSESSVRWGSVSDEGSNTKGEERNRLDKLGLATEIPDISELQIIEESGKLDVPKQGQESIESLVSDLFSALHKEATSLEFS